MLYKQVWRISYYLTHTWRRCFITFPSVFAPMWKKEPGWNSNSDPHWLPHIFGFMLIFIVNIQVDLGNSSFNMPHWWNSLICKTNFLSTKYTLVRQIRIQICQINADFLLFYFNCIFFNQILLTLTRFLFIYSFWVHKSFFKPHIVSTPVRTSDWLKKSSRILTVEES